MSLIQQGGVPSSPPLTQEATQSSLTQRLLNNPLQILEDIKLERKKTEWASWVNTQFELCKSQRSPFERQWHINIAFVNGKHYVSPIESPTVGFRLVTPQAPPWRVRLVINKIRTAVRTETSKLLSNRPMPVVLPSTTEDEDFSSARIAEQILRAHFASNEFQSELRSCVWWGTVTGIAFIKQYWDGGAFDPDAQLPAKPNPLGPNLPPVETLTVGKIISERINPFHIYVPDLLSETLEKQPYIMHVTTRAPSWVEERFKFKPTADTRAIQDINKAASLISKGSESVLDSVLVKEVWLKKGAHPDFPQGGLLTIINDKCVQYVSEWPWPFQEFPFYKFTGIPTGGFYTDSVLVDLIPLQKEYNKTKSQMIEIKNMMGKPKLLAQEGSVNVRRITSEPGQAVIYKMGFAPPTVIAGVEVPVSMGVELDRLTSDFDDISGQHEITRGNSPSQVSSGTAIAFLQEQDDSKLSDQVFGIEFMMQMLGTHYLKLVAKYWVDERLVKIVGKDSDYEAKHWKGSDLRNNTDVRIQSGSALPVSKAARQALITEFMQNGWLTPEVGLDILELGGFEKVVEDLLVDKRQAQRENMRMSELPEQEVANLISAPVGPDGQPITDATGQELDENGLPHQPQPVVPVNTWDNNEQHIHWHNQYRKTQSFELLSDVLKENFELHVQAHQMAMSMPQMGNAGLVANQELAPEGTSPSSGIMPVPEEEDDLGGEIAAPA